MRGPKLFVDPVLKIVGGQLTRRLRGLWRPWTKESVCSSITAILNLRQRKFQLFPETLNDSCYLMSYEKAVNSSVGSDWSCATSIQLITRSYTRRDWLSRRDVTLYKSTVDTKVSAVPHIPRNRSIKSIESIDDC